jgi:tetratricopeptide (TPR) repeat protein
MRRSKSVLAILVFAVIAFGADHLCATAQDIHDRLVDSINQHRLENAAQAFEDQKLYERAVEDWDELVRTYPNQSKWLSGSCFERAIWGQELDRALADCDAAVQLSPDNAHALDSRGFVHFRRNEFDAALADYQAALALGAPNTSLFMRGVTRIRLGQTAAGERDVATAAARDPGVVSRFSGYGVVSGTGTSRQSTGAAASAQTREDQEPLTEGTEPQYAGFNHFLQYQFGVSRREIRQTAPSASWRESENGGELGAGDLTGGPPLTIGGTQFATVFDFYETNDRAPKLGQIAMEYRSDSDTPDQCLARYESVLGAVERDLGHLLTESERPSRPLPDFFSLDASDGADGRWRVEQFVSVDVAPLLANSAWPASLPALPACDIKIELKRYPGDDGSEYDDLP